MDVRAGVRAHNCMRIQVAALVSAWLAFGCQSTVILGDSPDLDDEFDSNQCVVGGCGDSCTRCEGRACITGVCDSELVCVPRSTFLTCGPEV
jgi:hypothetical protein